MTSRRHFLSTLLAAPVAAFVPAPAEPVFNGFTGGHASWDGVHLLDLDNLALEGEPVIAWCASKLYVNGVCVASDFTRTERHSEPFTHAPNSPLCVNLNEPDEGYYANEPHHPNAHWYP